MKGRTERCAVVEYTYYCEVIFDRADYRPGVYAFRPSKDGSFPGYQRIVTLSHRVWRQGPKGGVKIIKDRTSVFRNIRYVTTNENKMKEFMWIKLKAKNI